MVKIRVFPIWRLSPRYEELEVEGKVSLRETIADNFEIDGRGLEARDRKGNNVPLDVLVGERGDVDLAISLRPILHPFGLFEEGHRTVAPPAHTATGDIDLKAGEPDGWPLMSDQEQALARDLAALGFGLDLSDLAADRLIESFPPVPKGFERSPYRLLLAAAYTLTEQGIPMLNRLDQQVEEIAQALWEKLRLSHPDALDLRLHLFVEPVAAGELLTQRFNTDGQPAFSGAVYRGWRRIVVHPYGKDDERLAQMANVGRLLAIERMDAGVRSEIQRACGDFVTAYDGSERRLDYQACATVVTMEEILQTRAEILLLERLESEICGTHHQTSSSGVARDLATRILQRSGLLERLNTDQQLLGQMARPLAADAFQEQVRRLFGGDIETLDSDSDQELREWLRSLEKGQVGALLPEDCLKRIAKTVAINIACNLRFEIESFIEQEVFPPSGSPDYSLAQLLETMAVLREDLRDFCDPARESRIAAWLNRRREDLKSGFDVQRESVRSVGDPLFNKLGRFLRRIGTADQQLYRELAGEVEVLQRRWIELKLIEALLESAGAGKLGKLFEFADDLIQRFAELGTEIPALRSEFVEEIERREKAVRFGTLGANTDLSAHLHERLKRTAEELPVAEAFRAVLRRDGQLRDLFHLQPDTLLADLMSFLMVPFTASVREIAAETGVSDIDRLLPAALHELFTDAPVQPSGRQGVPGALDAHTHVIAVFPPPVAKQIPDLKDRLIDHLVNLNLFREPAVTLHESTFASGLILVRCVHALNVEEFVP